MTYSAQLRQRVVDYFASRHGLEITDAQAADFLHSLAGVYEWAAWDSGGSGSAALAAGPAAEVGPSITPTSGHSQDEYGGEKK